MSDQKTSTNKSERPTALAGDAGYLTLYDLNVITDTLYGSLSIRDGGTLFKFSYEQRKMVLQRLFDRMDKTPLRAPDNDRSEP